MLFDGLENIINESTTCDGLVTHLGGFSVEELQEVVDRFEDSNLSDELQELYDEVTEDLDELEYSDPADMLIKMS